MFSAWRKLQAFRGDTGVIRVVVTKLLEIYVQKSGLGFDSHCWSCVEMSGKLVIPCCCCPPSSNRYLVEQKMLNCRDGSSCRNDDMIKDCVPIQAVKCTVYWTYKDICTYVWLQAAVAWTSESWKKWRKNTSWLMHDFSYSRKIQTKTTWQVHEVAQPQPWA